MLARNAVPLCAVAALGSFLAAFIGYRMTDGMGWMRRVVSASLVCVVYSFLFSAGLVALFVVTYGLANVGQVSVDILRVFFAFGAIAVGALAFGLVKCGIPALVVIVGWTSFYMAQTSSRHVTPSAP